MIMKLFVEVSVCQGLETIYFSKGLNELKIFVFRSEVMQYLRSNTPQKVSLWNWLMSSFQSGSDLKKLNV